MTIPIRRQPLALVASGVAAVLLFTGCQTGGGEPEPDSGAAGGDFTYWSMFTQEEPQAQALMEVIAAYEAETGSAVTVEWQGRQVLTQVMTNLLGGEIPDLVDQEATALATQLTAVGETASLADLYAASVPGEDASVGDVINMDVVDLLPDYAEDGEPHYLPFSLSGGLFMFNSNDPLVTEAPQTWEDVLSICEAAKAASRGCFGVDGDVGYYVDLYLENLLVRYGGPGSVNELITDASGAGWDTDAVRQTFEMAEQLASSGYFVEGYNSSKYPQQQNDWAAGRSVFMVNANYVITETMDYRDPDFALGATAFPITDKPEYDSTDVGSFGFVVLNKGERQDGAKAFLAFLMKKENMEQVASTANLVVARPDAELPAELQPIADVFNQSNLRMTFETSVPGDYYAKVLDVSFARVILGQLSAEEGLAEGRALHVAFWENQ